MTYLKPYTSDRTSVIFSCREQGISGVVRSDRLEDFYLAGGFDLITNLDVLEHIAEDEQFLSDAKKILHPGGYILVTVPAYQFLWTRFDEMLGHKRRYSAKEIREKLERNGYRIVRSSYFMFFLSPAFIVYRLIQKMTEIFRKKTEAGLKEFAPNLPWPFNGLFIRILFLEAWLIQRLTLPFGTSIIVLAKKLS